MHWGGLGLFLFPYGQVLLNSATDQKGLKQLRLALHLGWGFCWVTPLAGTPTALKRGGFCDFPQSSRSNQEYYVKGDHDRLRPHPQFIVVHRGAK
jgi:hypothetical protein